MAFVGKAKYLVFDTEAGGLDTFNNPVLQCFIATADSKGNLIEKREWLIHDPERPGSPEAAEVHGLSTEVLAEKGASPEEAFQEIKDFFLKHRDLTWVAYNMVFDLSILDSEFKRYGITGSFGEWASQNAALFDPLVVDRGKDKYRKGNRKLESVARHYGIAFDPDAAHDAVYDVTKTAEVAVAVASKFGVPSKDEHRIMHRAWAENLTDYFARVGKKDEKTGKVIIVGADWPLYLTPTS